MDMKISQNKIKKEGGVVVLPLEEYQRLLIKAVPHYYLTGREAKELDESVNEAEREYKDRKTKKFESLEDVN